MMIESIVVGPFAVNTYLVACEQTRKAMLIDPGDDAVRIRDWVQRRQVTVTAIYNTHGHIDHLAAVPELKREFGIPFYIHQADEFLVRSAMDQARFFGLKLAETPRIDAYLTDNQSIEVGTLSMRVLHTPGHSPGHVSFYLDPVVFSGDALFAGSIGRTDLPGGDMRTLLHAIRSRLLTLPGGTRVLSGHGPESTIDRENISNPFLTGMNQWR